MRLEDGSNFTDSLEVSDEDWSIAIAREAVMRDLLSSKPTPEMVAEACERIGLSRSQLYRLMSLYRENPTTVTLVPSKSGRPPGTRLLSAEMEAIIKKEIETVYLRNQKPKLSQLYRSIKHGCHAAGLTPPSQNAVRRRVEQIPLERRVRERDGNKAADDRFRPVKGSLSSERPLGMVQLDHTRVDAFIVDSETRQPVCRPWVTLAIDIATRMVFGIYLSLEAPSAVSLAMTMLHGASPKASWLKARGIAAPWPMHGLPETVHSDNGKDFHSKAFQRGCLQFGIAHEFRPVKQPNYGGHIERLIGTVMGEVHLIPGATFSNIADKGSYDPERHAALTFQEMEQWLAIEIVKYHASVHRGIGMTPMAAWNQAIAANFRPRIIDDEHTFMLAFLPAADRTVNREGIVRDGLHYQAPVLSAWLGAKVLVRWNPLDLGRIWVKGPVGPYMMVPLRDVTKPHITQWERTLARESLKARGLDRPDEALIFDAVTAQRRILENATDLTKSQRKLRERLAQAARTTSAGRAIDCTPGSTPLPGSHAAGDPLDVYPFKIKKIPHDRKP